MTHFMRTLAIAVATFGAAAGCTSDTGPATLTLDDVSEPDSNTAVVVLSRDVVEDGDTVKAGVEAVYTVEDGRIPHVLAADLATKQVTFVVSDLYTAQTFLTDGAGQNFWWTGPSGIEYHPVEPCEVTVRAPFVFGSPSTLVVETACEVAAIGQRPFTVLAKARRFATLGGGQ